MKALNISLFSLIFFIFFSCRKQSNNEFEQNVFNDVFISAVDSTLIDMRTYLGFDYSKKQIDSIKMDTLNRVIAFNEKIEGVVNIFKEDLPKNYKPISDSIWTFNLTKFNTQKYIFKKSSELSTENELIEWQKKYPKFVGSLGFSQIYFDKERNNGAFQVAYNCGSKCGLGYVVYIKKEHKKWKIQTVKRTWIS